MGAIVGVKPPVAIINEEVRRFFGVNSDYIKTQEDEALAEIERRRALWGAAEAKDYRGKIVIVVDDGIATGTSAEAAVAVLRQEKPEMIILAVPVASQESLERLRPQVDRVVCLHTPDTFLGVGAFYRDFHQLSDAEVAAYLRESKPGRR
jgi:predicted phosphoribosyltransferase